MAPTITSFTPSHGNSSGGTSVTITGTGFVADATTNRVMVGDYLGTIVGTPTTTSITFLTPPGTASSTAKLMVLDTAAGLSVQSATSYTYDAVAVLEQLVSTLARKWKVDIDVSGAQDGSNYIPIRALSSVVVKVTQTTQDDTDYDAAGWGSEVKTLQKWSLDLTLIRKAGITSNAYDPGQEALRTAADLYGSAGTVRVRFYDRDGHGTEAYYGYAAVQWSPVGGAPTAIDTVTVTLLGNGARTAITNPIS